jgi:hypothetical protein
VRALLQHHGDARDIEIVGAGLNETFLTLTAADRAPADSAPADTAPAD